MCCTPADFAACELPRAKPIPTAKHYEDVKEAVKEAHGAQEQNFYSTRHFDLFPSVHHQSSSHLCFRLAMIVDVRHVVCSHEYLEVV